MSPTAFQSLQTRAWVFAVVASLAGLLLLTGGVTGAEARGGCGKTGVASKRSDRAALPRVRDAVKCLINEERSARNLKLKRSGG